MMRVFNVGAEKSSKSGFVDLHMHTTASDGVTSPRDLLGIVRKAEVSAFSVTDHDTLVGSAEIRQLLTENDPELIAGVELSAGEPGEDLHILAYFFDGSGPGPESAFVGALDEFRKRRESRGERIVELLRSNGLKVDFADVRASAAGGPIGRPHVADALVRAGAVKSYDEAFKRWIGYGRPGYAPKETMTPAEVMRLTHEAGGIAVLAHPFVNHAEDSLARLTKLGIDGLEVYHPMNPAGKRKAYRKFAAENGLLITGGSDYHGRNDHHGLVGEEKVPYELLELMRERATRYAK